MTGNAGERLFQAMEQIPDEIILEAAQDQPHLDAEADGEKLNADKITYTEIDKTKSEKIKINEDESTDAAGWRELEDI